MATSQKPLQSEEDAKPRETRQYNRQTTDFDYQMFREPRAGGQRVLVRRPSVDLAQLTRQRSRAIIDNFFRKSSPPVLETLPGNLLNKISDVELGKQDYWKAQQHAIKREELHAELRTEVTTPHSRHKRRSHTYRRNRVKLAMIKDVSEGGVHSLNNGVDEELQRFEHTEETTTAVITNNHITKSVESKPKLVTNPFDAEFAEADRGAHRTVSDPQQSQKAQVDIVPEGDGMLKKLPNRPSSDGDANGASCHTQHVLDTVDCECERSDACSSKVTRMTSETKEGASGMSTVDLTNVHRVIHSQGESDMHIMSGNILLTNQSEQCIAISASDTSTSKISSKLSTGSLHLDLSTEQGSTSDASNFSNEEEDDDNDDSEVKKKPKHLVAETPVEVDGPLPCRFHNIPQFSEIAKELGHVPSLAEYFTYRLDKITVDLESRYPNLDKCYQQLISGFQGALSYEVFHQAAMRVQSQADMMYDGVFMVLNFGRYLFKQFPDYASNYTTQWVDDYIVHQGGWDRVTDMYYEEQLTPSPLATVKMVGASGVSEEALNDILSQDECSDGHQMNSTDGQRVPSIQVIKSNIMSHHKKKPANVSPPVWDISQEICFPALNRSCSVEVLPCVPEHDVEDLSESVKENNAENVTDMTPITPSARLTSHKSLDNDSPTAHGHVYNPQAGYYPIRRSNSAPNLSRILSDTEPTSPTQPDDDEAPRKWQQERRRSSLESLQDFNDVFLSYIPYITGVAAPAVVAVHVAMEFVKRLSSS